MSDVDRIFEDACRWCQLNGCAREEKHGVPCEPDHQGIYDCEVKILEALSEAENPGEFD